MKSLLSSLLLSLLIFSPTTFATNDSHRALAEEMLTLSHVGATLDTQVKAGVEQQRLRMKDLKLNEASQAAVDTFMDGMATLMAQSLGWDANKEYYLELYTQTYDEKELNEIVKFYKSDVGQKLLNQSAALGAQIAVSTQTKMTELQPKLMALQTQLQADLKAANAPPPVPVPAEDKTPTQ
ncbi:MAG: DUF2059 domain-containing protein [Pseudomonadales bacterium]